MTDTHASLDNSLTEALDTSASVDSANDEGEDNTMRGSAPLRILSPSRVPQSTAAAGAGDGSTHASPSRFPRRLSTGVSPQASACAPRSNRRSVHRTRYGRRSRRTARGAPPSAATGVSSSTVPRRRLSRLECATKQLRRDVSPVVSAVGGGSGSVGDDTSTWSTLHSLVSKVPR